MSQNLRVERMIDWPDITNKFQESQKNNKDNASKYTYLRDSQKIFFCFNLFAR